MKSSLTRTLSRLSHSDRFVSELIVASKDRSRQTTNAPEVAVQGAQGRCSVLNSTLEPQHSTLPSTRGGTRTPTPSRETDFESVASTDSATRACRATQVHNAARAERRTGLAGHSNTKHHRRFRTRPTRPVQASRLPIRRPARQKETFHLQPSNVPPLSAGSPFRNRPQRRRPQTTTPPHS